MQDQHLLWSKNSTKAKGKEQSMYYLLFAYVSRYWCEKKLKWPIIFVSAGVFSKFHVSTTFLPCTFWTRIKTTQDDFLPQAVSIPSLWNFQLVVNGINRTQILITNLESFSRKYLAERKNPRLTMHHKNITIAQSDQDLSSSWFLTQGKRNRKSQNYLSLV